MGTTISEGIQTIHLRDAKDDEVITYIQNREFEDQPDAVNEDVLGNGRLAKWNALGKAKGTFNTLTNYSDGRFNAKDSDMEQAMEDFWGGVNEGITRYGSDLSKPQGLAYLIKKVLFNWFSNY
ncbi:MAG: hypothetical protein LBD75_02610 [Candidatus Peribacteria bacterium]|jgi:hypothetical protein|nr:hypothetical protein [Candidatus Peribacteria bacterium]